MRKRINGKTELTLWQRVISGQHPARRYKFKSERLRKYSRIPVGEIRDEAAEAARGAGQGQAVVFRVVGVVTHVREKMDKNLNLMGFFGVLGVKGYIDALCFASVWPKIRKAIKPGRLIEIQLEYNRGQGIYSGDILRWLK
jgi:DNA polymerase III alpha subunit